MSQLRILIVDGELSLLRSLREAVLGAQIGAEVLTASTSDEALELMGMAHVQVLVACRDLQSMDGIALITEAKTRWPELRCALMAAQGDERSRVVGRLAGACTIIDKPFEVGDFVTKVRDLLPSTGFTGTRLTGFNLADLLQLVAMSGQEMTLRIERGEQCGELSLASGSLVHAVAGALTGAEAAKSILSWRDGQVLSSPGVLPKTEWTVDIAIMELLVEAARRSDEHERDDVRAQLDATQAGILGREGVCATAVITSDSGTEVLAASATAQFDRTLGVQTLLALQGQLALAPDDQRPNALVLVFESSRLTAVSLMEGKLLQVVWTEAGSPDHDIAPCILQMVPALERGLPKLLMDVELDLGEDPDASRFEIVGA